MACPRCRGVLHTAPALPCFSCMHGCFTVTGHCKPPACLASRLALRGPVAPSLHPCYYVSPANASCRPRLISVSGHTARWRPNVCMVCPYPSLKPTVLQRLSCETVELPPRVWQSRPPERGLTLTSPCCRGTSPFLGLRPLRTKRTTLARFECRARLWITAVSRSDADRSGACVAPPPPPRLVTQC